MLITLSELIHTIQTLDNRRLEGCHFASVCELVCLLALAHGHIWSTGKVWELPRPTVDAAQRRSGMRILRI